jgi:predicted nucleic acid-binding protein
LIVFLDTSVLVASLVKHHPHHARAMPVIREVLKGGDRGHVAAQGLAETYAVLTSLPVAPRIGPEAAAKLLTENVLPRFRAVALTSREYDRVVTSVAAAGVAGGAVYDAIQLECARKSAAERIYTFNLTHFRRLAPALAERISAP